jgi:hypothetical protein
MIELPPFIEKRLEAEASKAGISKTEYAAQLLVQSLPPSVEEDPTLALFAQWDREDTQLTPEEQAKNERIYVEIEKNGIPRIQI